MNPTFFFLPRPLAFLDALRLQEALHQARLREQIPDTVLFLEHLPVITLGRRGRTRYLLTPPERLAEMGVELHTASRGGDVTYHAPGQLVVYPILKLQGRSANSHRYLWQLEETALRTAAAYGVDAFRREGMVGVWSDAGKLAAIGFHLKRWVTLHGLSLNVNLDLKGFSLIVGCGLEGEPVVSLQSLLGDRAPSLVAVRNSAAGHLAEVLGQSFEVWEPGRLLSSEWRQVLHGAACPLPL